MTQIARCISHGPQRSATTIDMSLQPLDKRTRDAGRRACAQLVRAVSSGTLAPLQRAAAGSVLARLHELVVKDGYIIIAALDYFDDARATVSALAEVYSVSLREVTTPTPTPGPSAAGEDQAQLKESKHIPGAGARKPHAAAAYGQRRPGSGRDDSQGTASGSGTTDGGAAAGHSAGPFPEVWVPLLVDSSAVVANCLRMGVFTINPTGVAELNADWERRVRQIYACGTALSSALLRSDALPALSRLLSAEAQRGPARALLTPRQLAMCLQPLAALLPAAHKFYNVPLPVSPQRLRQPYPPAPNSPTTATTAATTPAPSPVPPTLTPTPGTSTRPSAGPSAATSAAASSDETQTISSTLHTAAGEPRGSAAAPVPQGCDPTASSSSPALPTPQKPQCLGATVLIAVAESGVVEAACRAAVGALEQGGRGWQQQQQQQGAACATGGDREELVRQLLEVPRRLVESLQLAAAEMLPKEPLQTIFMGPCVQVRGARSTDDAGLTLCSAGC